MPVKKEAGNPNGAIIALLEKSLILQLFALNVSQDKIAKKLKMSKTTVNDFLKGIDKNGKKETKQP
jgi:transposase